MFHGIKNEERDVLDCLLLLDNVGIPTELVEAFDRVVNVSPGVMRKISGVQSTESTKAASLLRIPTSFYDIDNNEDGFDFQMLFPTLNRWSWMVFRPLFLKFEACGLTIFLIGSPSHPSFRPLLWFLAPNERVSYGFFLYADDPGNLGTLLRTAMAFGWDGVFLLPGCCDPFNDKAIRASRGSCFQISIVSGRWVHLESLKCRFNMKMLAGHPENSGDKKTSFALSPEFAFLWEDKPLALVVGSEGHGLSEESKTVGELISIPMAGGYESLNVSVAGGIFLFMLEARKHRTC